MYVCIYVRVYICTCVYMYVCIYVRMYICMCVYMCVCMYIPMCVNLSFCGVLQNMSSWVLYNMAALYWRIKGDAPSAIECIRRAMFFCTW